MAKNRGGRPTVMTEIVLQKLEECFLAAMTDREACCIAGIGEATLYDYCAANEKFSEKKETLKDMPSAMAKNIIKRSLTDGELSTAKYVLDQKQGKKLDITTQGNALPNIITIVPPNFGDEKNEH